MLGIAVLAIGVVLALEGHLAAGLTVLCILAVLAAWEQSRR